MCKQFYVKDHVLSFFTLHTQYNTEVFNREFTKRFPVLTSSVFASYDSWPLTEIFIILHFHITLTKINEGKILKLYLLKVLHTMEIRELKTWLNSDLTV